MNVQVVRFMQDKNGIDLHELEQKISPKTKALVICNPHNPLGYVLSKDQINDLYAFCEKHSIALISDEVWSDMVHTERGFSSAINVGKNAWVIYGFSKGFGMAGLRIGAIIAPNENSVLDLMNKQGYDRTIEGASTLSQIAATSAMQHSWEYTCQLKSLFLNNLIHAQERISNETICRCEVPEGTFVMTIHHPEPWDTEIFCDFARNEFKIAVVPGLEKWFGAGAKNTFRISLATNEKTAVEGVDRLVKAIQTFGSNL
jgi:aspartate/methionine/tyrosine aminotransferase